MCGHGTIGLVETLRYLGKIDPGEHRIETPVGVVTAVLHDTGEISVTNVPSYRYAKDVVVSVPGIGTLLGDVAWGGNWFFLCGMHGENLSIDHQAELVEYAWRVRLALSAAGVTGCDGEEIDHIELFGPPQRSDADSRNFVLCPGKAYDRSPCGTGTSAKLACLYEDGQIAVGDTWRQESITGSVFQGTVARIGDSIVPTIRGSAWVIGESTLLLSDDDPLCWGLKSAGQ